MVIDASAVLAIFLDEPEKEEFAAKINDAGGGLMSAVNYWEVLSRAFQYAGSPGRAAADALVRALRIQVIELTASDAARAADAFEVWGKAARAKLNLGDCFAYALAWREGDGLLFKGQDFSQTDVRSALNEPQ